jgi:MoaA/NifB/PqqE/SkfB family radical SAM enzyme
MMNQTNEHSWCVNAFHGMSGNNDGSSKMCCMIDESYNYMGGKQEWFLGEKTIQQNFTNPIAQSIKSNLEAGVRDRACNQCWQEEDGGRKSKRLRDNEKYFHAIEYEGAEPFTGLAKFELNLGNTCNIKCRTCHPTISSLWMKEDYDLNHANRVSYKDYSINMKKYHQTYDEDSDFWPDLANNLSTIRQFDFYGGEPFLSKKMWEVLKLCVDQGYAKDIELHYNTNGTTWPEETELWKNFKHVNLSFSIDGTGEQFEYMRYPAVWTEAVDNMKKASAFAKQHGNLSLSWCITLSSINIYNLPETLDAYYDNFTDFGLYLNLVHRPAHFNMSSLPADIKQAVLDRLHNIPKHYEHAWWQLPGIIGFIENGTPCSEEEWAKFLSTIKTHDVYREQDFFATFEAYGQVVKAHNG